VQIGYTGYTGTSGNYTPAVTLPDTTGAVAHWCGIATQTRTTAGGLWVQTKGRVFCAKVDGGTDVALGTHLTATNGAQYLSTDHATVGTAAGFAIYEGCRHGAAGATAWTITSGFPNLVDFPIYKIAETIAVAAQGIATGDPACVIYLTGIPAII
jgi:hypothetical protein